MKLHRLTLTNYRGVLHRDIEFPERGVVVVSGANEIGKSSMIEALDLLLTVKDRSSKKEVKAVKPTHADVGAEVSAEISTGPYRFIYRKRFHKKAETVLTELAPTRRQLTGDEAHDRVLAILDETVDTALWQAQRVLQASATAPVDLSGCDALSRALDVAAGAADGAAQVADVLGGSAGDADPLLIDKIEREYLEYFTATGRPTGVWAAATSRLRAADDAVAQCTAALREVEQAVTQHAVLTAELSGLAERVSAAEARRAADAERAGRATAELARLEGELAAAQPDVVAAELRSATAALEVLLGEREAAATALAEISAALKVYGSQGRRGALDAAEAEREHAHGEFLRVGRRARAAGLLRTVMLRHRESARLRYVEPFRAEIERLGRLVFGPDFEVDIDTDLTIRSRTLAGTTVGYESLSGGAKEQMGIVARLACASLVAKEDTVPVVIDDALGFTDPERLTKMAAVFDAVGGDGQVIVLTCSPDRYAAIDDAQLIELTA
ncbi:AAA family ATPase [Mycolicibacterium neoaurum]|uniref:Hydrolase n=1 Tax=Mycolicibacterium neoaurum TaxID=1795 RepID=A0AAV2WNM6_MYCNE|nr:ATP-binding protein [Mycolicibacterium neoaurum]CDQ45891.1 hydrolase [Mycolicibacterium neoaurum]